MGVNDTISTFNATLRTLLATAVVGGLGYGGWIGYSKYNEAEFREKELLETKERNKRLQADLDAAHHEVAALTASLRLMKFNHRVARVKVIDVFTSPVNGEKRSHIEFIELNDQGDPMGQPQQFELNGDLIYIDYWVVKFDDKYIEKGLDLDRSTSICLFHRMFGEGQKPIDGESIDDPSSQPLSYSRGGNVSPFEKQIWGDFWEVANDPARQEAMGIRAAHGEAVSMKVIEGKSYLIQLRASDGLTMVQEENSLDLSRPAL